MDLTPRNSNPSSRSSSASRPPTGSVFPGLRHRNSIPSSNSIRPRVPRARPRTAGAPTPWSARQRPVSAPDTAAAPTDTEGRSPLLRGLRRAVSVPAPVTTATFTCSTEPLSPGLFTRTDTFTFVGAVWATSGVGGASGVGFAAGAASAGASTAGSRGGAATAPTGTGSAAAVWAGTAGSATDGSTTVRESSSSRPASSKTAVVASARSGTDGIGMSGTPLSARAGELVAAVSASTARQTTDRRAAPPDRDRIT